jgi:ABC-2 type transport system permease protein
MARYSFGAFTAFVTAPLLTLVFLAIAMNAGRPDLAVHALVAPGLITLWSVALLVAGELVTQERDNGSLETLVAAPLSLAALLTGRIMAVTLVSLVGFAESWVVAWLLFGTVVPVSHPVVFIAALAATALAMAGTASVMSAVFVMTRSARTFQNSLNYPFYILGGVMVPVALLPGWLELVSRGIFLSWSADLLRDAVGPSPVSQVLPRLTMVLLLGTMGYGVGMFLLRRAVDRLRRTGSLSYA